jgi:hypothetical protein
MKRDQPRRARGFCFGRREESFNAFEHEIPSIAPSLFGEGLDALTAPGTTPEACAPQQALHPRAPWRERGGDRPHQRIEPVGRAAGRKPVGPKSHISSSSSGKRRIDVLHAPCSYSAATGSARSHLPRVACTVSGTLASTCGSRAHHLAALVHLGDQRVGLEPAIERDRLRGPAGGREARTVASSST